MAQLLYSTQLSLVTTVNNTEFQLALGAITYVHWTSTGTFATIGLFAIGGNVDGMVVTFSNENTTGTLQFLDDSSSEATLANRYRIVSGGGNVAPNGSMTLRYNAFIGRWIAIAKC